MGKFYDFGPNLAKNLENSTIEVGGLAALWTAHGSTQHIRVPPPTGPDPLKKGLIYFLKTVIIASRCFCCCFYPVIVFLARNEGFSLFLLLETQAYPQLTVCYKILYHYCFCYSLYETLMSFTISIYV